MQGLTFLLDQCGSEMAASRTKIAELQQQIHDQEQRHAKDLRDTRSAALADAAVALRNIADLHAASKAHGTARHYRDAAEVVLPTGQQAL